MAYVTNKVGNDSNSFQTPQAGIVFGEGDFVFRYNSEDNNNEKNMELVSIPSPNDDYKDITNKDIESFKELVSDRKNRIKINEIINIETKEVVAKLNFISNSSNVYNDDEFKGKVTDYENIIKNIKKKLILLVYYGEGQYNTLITKTIEKISNIKRNNGADIYTFLQSYPCLILYYNLILAGIDSSNLDFIKDIISINSSNTYNMYYNSNNLLVKVSTNIAEISNKFGCFYETKYKNPFAEYNFIKIQPDLDDLLFLGESYKQLYYNVEIIISVWNAFIRFKYDNDINDIWGTSGKFKNGYTTKDIMDMDVYDIIDKIGIWEKLGDNKEKFIISYNRFMNTGGF